jgi:hypothetical protein
VAIAERRRRLAAAQPGSQNRGYVGATLLRRGRKPGNRLAIPSERKCGIADRKDIGVSRNRKIRADPDAAGAWACFRGATGSSGGSIAVRT